jgi:hypothetical protein
MWHNIASKVMLQLPLHQPRTRRMFLWLGITWKAFWNPLQRVEEN